MLDIAVIGSGPQALSFVTRLQTLFPFSTFTDEQHQRIHHWKQRYQSGDGGDIHYRVLSLKDNQDNCGDCCPDVKHADVCVIDPSGKWMSQWRSQFDAYAIRYLRSPVSFHPDP
jgi:hypothetical protein